ncbi:MAG TPA: rhomboid family intramembrane serine protease [Candidatus Limnocylindrales bacterium]
MTTDPSQPGPLDRATALAVLARADELLAAGELEAAAAHYQRVMGFDEAAVTASAYYGFGNALYRLDREDDALWAWRRVLNLPETPSTYFAWRQIAAAQVRDGDLVNALKSYREADRRAPPADKAEIASRLGWLAKETGDPRGAARHFRRSRGGNQPTLTYLIIALTSIVSFTAYVGMTVTRGAVVDVGQLYSVLWFDKLDVAAGELWRLVTVALVHAPDQIEFFLHLGFNMYALYLVGPAVESIYGWRRMLFMYVAAAVTASTASFVFGPPGEVATGASGAIFGLFGVLLVASRVHHPVLARRERAIMTQVGTIILLNLAFGFGAGAGGLVNIDNAAHVGGLIGGLWLGLILLPADAPTLASMWQGPGGSQIGWRPTAALQLAGVAILAGVVAIGIVIGDDGVRRGADVPAGAPAAVVPAPVGAVVPALVRPAGAGPGA